MGWGTVDPVYCHNCGHRNPEGVNFCSSCGHALLADGDDATITLHPTDEAETSEDHPDVTLVEVPHGAGVLVVTRGPNIGARYLLGEKVVRAGRHPESDIFLDDITVSRRHVEITPDGRGHLLTPGRGLVERHLREPGADRRGAALSRRRGPDRQVQARLPGGGERVTSRTYLSIGDVLTLLREEFPDVTISKIRFLESQGLVNPERSPSGYRKFFDHDVERLRWVLRQQREHFLPLKVIRDRLADGELDDAGRRRAQRQAVRARLCRRRPAAPATAQAQEQPTKADEEAMARILADASRRAAARLPEEVQASGGLQVVAEGDTSTTAVAEPGRERGARRRFPRPGVRTPDNRRRAAAAGTPRAAWRRRRRERAAPTGRRVPPRAEPAAAPPPAFQPPMRPRRGKSPAHAGPGTGAVADAPAGATSGLATGRQPDPPGAVRRQRPVGRGGGRPRGVRPHRVRHGGGHRHLRRGGPHRRQPGRGVPGLRDRAAPPAALPERAWSARWA